MTPLGSTHRSQLMARASYWLLNATNYPSVSVLNYPSAIKPEADNKALNQREETINYSKIFSVLS